MDPASVLAFVLVVLKSGKVAHKILTSFKDAPKSVKSAREDVGRLLATLERLSTCRALNESGDAALRASLDACRSDLGTFINKLTSLTEQAQGSRRDRGWKRFMAMWNEKALSNMSAKLATHVGNLNLHLNILQRCVPLFLSPLSPVFLQNFEKGADLPPCQRYCSPHPPSARIDKPGARRATNRTRSPPDCYPGTNHSHRSSRRRHDSPQRRLGNDTGRNPGTTLGNGDQRPPTPCHDGTHPTAGHWTFA